MVILLFVVLGGFWLVRFLSKMEDFKAQYEQSSEAQLRIGGLVGVILGVACMGMTQYMLRTQSTVMLKIAFMGPVLFVGSLPMLVAGKSKVGMFLLVPGLLAGVAAGFYFMFAFDKKQPNMASDAVAYVMDPVLDRLGLTTQKVTRAQLDAAIAAVTAKSAELNKRKQSVNPGDKAAMDALNHDIEAYNKQTAEVKAMYDAFVKNSKDLGDLRKRIAGAWQVQDSLEGVERTVVTHYNEDGSLLMQGTLSNGSTGTIDGHWEVGAGSTLIIYCNPSTNPRVMTTDQEQRYAVQRVDDKELVILGVDNVRTVKTRVK